MNLRSRLSTLIAARVVLVTLLMGSAILIQISRPGAFPSRPLLRPDRAHVCAERVLPGHAQVRRAPSLARRSAIRRGRAARLGLHSRHWRDHQQLLVALPAADHRGQHDSLSTRGAAVGRAQRGHVPGPRRGAVRRPRLPAGAPLLAGRGSADGARGAVHRRDQPGRFHRRRAPGRIAGGKSALRRCAARGRVRPDSRPRGPSTSTSSTAC